MYPALCCSETPDGAPPDCSRIVVERMSHPSLRERSHAECILQIPLFNKAKRKACVPSLTAYDSKGQPIPVAWSNTTDDFGNVSKRANLVGITDEKTVYVRRTDGKPFPYARILFVHSFSTAKEIAVFAPALTSHAVLNS